MLSNEENNENNLYVSKKTRHTESSEGNSNNMENDNKGIDQDEQSFHKKLTEKEITKGKRFDNYGNEITKNGKQKVTFIDKVKQVNFMDVIQIESFKEYNKEEEIKENKNSYNSCCSLL